ncbi:MAG TPA: hypothetical protein PKD64_14825 [Pirellulaceae bacterium]|nr:hypothetical protein [Pirellulaceae bacterium]HMO93456.1 hypothetical protein [Pirellulaceae bacterium]HMP68436.1 hypothetical protein [Pirellulaceae bacterium]
MSESIRLSAREQERRHLEHKLIENLRASRSDLNQLFEESCSHWGYEDLIYRFYHQSFKVYFIQSVTSKIVESLRALLPGRPLNTWFEQILAEGTGKQFEMEHNENWLETTRPMLEAFFHARYFLEMACRYANEFEEPPQTLPSGWASLLYLYDLR